MILIVLIFDPNTWQLDDGGGMDPEAMRRCMSFGFSDKKSQFAIGRCMYFDLFLLSFSYPLSYLFFNWVF